MNRHFGVYVDLGYNEPTKVVLIKADIIREMRHFPSQTEFQDLVSFVTDMIIEHDLYPSQLVAYGQPAFEAAVTNLYRRKINGV